MRKGNKIAKLISLILLIMSFTLLYLVVKVNVLPSKYIKSISIVIIISNFVLFISMTLFRSKFIKLFSLLCCIGLGYGIYSLFNTSSILTSMNINYKTNNYIVLVNKNSNYNKISNLSNKNIGYLSDSAKVLKKIRINYKPVEYKDSVDLLNALFSNAVDGIILEQSHIDIFKEEGYSIDGKTKIIYKFKMNTKVTNIINDVDTTEESFIVYLSGIDTYGSISSVSRTDANMLLVVNPKTKNILLISIPRDYYVNLYGKNAKDKLTHSGIYGIDTTIKTVEELLDIRINYYFKVNFTSIIDIVDSVNGIDVISDYTFTSKDGYKYNKGVNHLNGKETLSFVRERKAFSNGDRVRNINQQTMVTGLFNKVTSPDILIKYNDLLTSLKDSFITNMPQKRITSLIQKQLETKSKWTITNYYLDGNNSREYTYSYKANKLYVMIPNENKVKEVNNLIKNIMEKK